MSDAKHTSQDWEWADVVKGHRMGGIVAADGRVVCHFGDPETYYPLEGYPPSGEDRTLMLAAPGLLRELEHLVRLLEPLESAGTLSVPGLATLNGARAAIAKAKGETPC